MGSPAIVFGLPGFLVNFPIDLHNQPGPQAHKTHEVARYGRLPPKLKAGLLARQRSLSLPR